MITKNFKNYCKLSGIYMSGQSDNGKTGFRISDGTYKLYGLYNNSSYFTTPSGRQMFFGAGTTQPTVDDYTMENEINTLTIDTLVTKPVQESDTPENKYNQNYIIKYTAVVTNNTNEPITISEIGTGVNTESSTYMLYTRDVITPITIYPAESYTIEVKAG